eukprot:scaffold44921_cov66-Phaeocystis_antarctica.AAC.2
MALRNQQWTWTVRSGSHGSQLCTKKAWATSSYQAGNALPRHQSTTNARPSPTAYSGYTLAVRLRTKRSALSRRCGSMELSRACVSTNPDSMKNHGTHVNPQAKT